MRLTGQTADMYSMLLAMAVDALNINNWMQTKGGKRNRNRPKSIAQKLLQKKDKNNDVQGFRDAVDFELAKERILRNARQDGGD